ncbi:MAG: porin, partial [Gammaproteobacteria bacterium]|nr:porin [Gammaproteobacteria bacterium]
MAPLALLPSAHAAVGELAEAEQQYVLQLGFFANLDNALAFKKQLTEAGFEVQTVATGLPGEQRYQVITGQAEDSEDLQELADSIERRTGFESFVVPNPFETSKVREVFDQPKLKYLVAQAGNDMPLDPSPQTTSGYNTMMNRTPQEEIDSMPGFTAAGLQIIPTIGLSLGYDDNITRSNSDEISSWFYMVSPAIRAELPSDHSVLAVIASADIVRYQDSERDDRTNWNIRGEWAWDISTRQNLNLFAVYSEGADPRGTGRRQGDAGLIPLDPDEYKRWGYGGSWDYGAVGARGRLTLRAGANELEYTNNRETPPDDPSSIGTRALDRDWQYYGGTFYWRVAPKTSVLADYMYTDMNYKEAETSNSEIHTWGLGLTWDATARTSGRIQYGNQKRKFEDPTKEDYSGPAWLASINWRPRTYSLFTLTGTRASQEPDGNGDYVIRQDITLSWLHDWATRFGTTVDIGYGEDKYKPDGRDDELWYAGVGARYTFNQHFRFGAS